jgi:hypothetical protein
MTARKRPDPLGIAHPNAAGIDIGSDSHFVAVPPDRDDEPVREFRSFTVNLMRLADWLAACGIDTVAMESTGVYWIPLYELLQSRGFTVHLVNARHVKNVSGRKSDVLDCQWLQQLMSYGLLQGVFRPDEAICALRSVMRTRESLLGYQADHIRQMQKALTQMNVQLHNVIADIAGVSGQAILRAILAGERDPHALAPGVTGASAPAAKRSPNRCKATGGKNTCSPCKRRSTSTMPTTRKWRPVTKSSKRCWRRCSATPTTCPAKNAPVPRAMPRALMHARHFTA